MIRMVLIGWALWWSVGNVIGATVSTLGVPLNASGGVTMGPDGNIYVGDFGASLSNANGTTVYQVTPGGEISVFATGFSGASGNDFDSAGNLIQANIRSGQIHRVDPQGNLTVIGNLGTGSPVGVVVAPDDTVFATNCGGPTIVRVESPSSAPVIAQGSPLNCPNGLTLDDEGNLYTSNFNDGNIVKITPDGSMSILAATPASAGGTAGNGHLTFANDRLYVASNQVHSIFEVTLDGEVTLVAGSGQRGHTDGPAEQASFSRPNGVAVSADGRQLYLNENEDTRFALLNPNILRVVTLDDIEGAGPPITRSHAGAWFNPATPGQGFVIDVLAASQQLFVAWFTYEIAGAKVGDARHRWLTALGPIDGSGADLDVTLTTGGAFDASDAVSNSAAGSYGSIRLDFADCNNATLTYALDAVGLNGSMSLVRVEPMDEC